MIKNGWKRLKSHGILYNTVLVVLVYAALMLVWYAAMALGTRHGMKRTVPDFVGLQLRDAEYYAGRRGLKMIVNDSLHVPAYPGGIVLDQLPESGVDVKSGRKIYVTINSVRQKTVLLPYVAGRSLRQAKNMLDGAGLTIRELVYVDDIATNYVLSQYCDTTQIHPDTRMSVEMGSGITLHVGKAAGDEVTGVPYLLGRSLHEAKSKLWESGLNVGSVFYDDDMTVLDCNNARICEQSVAGGESSALGTAVSLQLTLDAEKVAEAEAAYARRIREAELERMRADSLEQALRMQADSLEALQPAEPAPLPVEEDEFFM